MECLSVSTGYRELDPPLPCWQYSITSSLLAMASRIGRVDLLPEPRPRPTAAARDRRDYGFTVGAEGGRGNRLLGLWTPQHQPKSQPEGPPVHLICPHKRGPPLILTVSGKGDP